MQQLINHELDPSFNLAFEEEMLLSDIISNSPAFCLWRNAPSVIVGVSQVEELEVNLQYCKEKSISVVRRRTGGGAVYHDSNNLNFSFFFPEKPEGNPFYHVYDLMRPAFRQLGIEIDRSGTNDMLFDGRKFSGMAERVIGGRFMVHGTILFDTDFGEMAKALTTVKGKFSKPRGVASRHAEVINLKGYLKDIDDITALENALGSYLSDTGERGCVNLPTDFLERVRRRAETDYRPLNQ